MKKLKVALVLLFTLCCSMFVFAACDDGTDAALKSITVEGQITSFTEKDTKFTLGDDFKVTAQFETSDEAKASRVLNREEYEVKADALKAALEANNRKDYGAARGTYTVTVTCTMGDKTRQDDYTVTVDHDWNAEKTECMTCGATQKSYAVEDKIVIEGWGGGVTSFTQSGDTGSYSRYQPAGSAYVSYGSIGMGQAITIKGKGYQTNSSQPYFFPIIGFHNGAKGFTQRNDTWLIYNDPADKGTYHNPGYTSGYTVTQEATTEEFKTYYSGTTGVTSDWGSESAPSEFEIVWNYADTGVLSYTINNIGAGKSVTYYVNVPNAVYEIVVYGEYFVYNVTEVTYTNNLTLEDFRVFANPDKLVYAENTNIEIDAESKNIYGLNAVAFYNQATSNVQTQITTYDIYADLITYEEVYDEETGSQHTITTTHVVDLRENPLQAEMENFRVKFGDFEIGLDITVVPSKIAGVTTSYDFEVGGVQFENDAATYTYDAYNSSPVKAPAIVASGSPNKLSEEQKAAYGTTCDYYVSFRIEAEIPNTLSAADVLMNYLTAEEYVSYMNASQEAAIRADEYARENANSWAGEAYDPENGWYGSEEEWLADWQATYNNTYEGVYSYYIVQAYGVGHPTPVTDDNARAWTYSDGINVIIPIAKNGGWYDLTNRYIPVMSYVEHGGNVDYATVQYTTIVVDLSGLVMPTVSAVEIENDTTIDEGGEIVVRYYLPAATKTETGEGAEKVVTYTSVADNYKFTFAGLDRPFAEVSKVDADKKPVYAAVGGGFEFWAEYGNEQKDYLDVHYVFPAIDVTSSNINITRSVGVQDKDGKVLATKEISYNLVLSEKAVENGYYELMPGYGVYLKADDAKLYFVAPVESYFLPAEGFEFLLNVNNATSTNPYGIAYSVGFTAYDGVVEMNEVNIVTKNTEVVLGLDGTLGNNADGDYGCLYVVGIDLAAAYGVRTSDATETYYMEISQGEPLYLQVKKVEGKDVISVLTLPEVTPADKITVPANCVVGGRTYYEYKVGNTKVFAYQGGTTPATSAHNFVANADNTVYTCDKCGSTYYADNAEKGAANIKVGPIEGALTNGITVTFDLEGNKSDWESGVINPLKDATAGSNMHITLPNLDTGSTSIGGNTIGFTVTNMFPSANSSATFYKDEKGENFAWNAFQAEGKHRVTIVIDPMTGITYYRDDLKVLNYSATGMMSDNTTTMASFIETVLDLIEKNGFIFGCGTANMGTVTNLHVYAAALNEAKLHVAWAGYTKTLNAKLGDEAASKLPAVFADWVDIGNIYKGTKVTITGTQKSAMVSAWHTFLYELSVNGGWTQRMDNFGWSFDPNNLVQTWQCPYAYAPEDTKLETPLGDWFGAYQNIAKNCTWTLEVSFSEAGLVTATITAVNEGVGTYVHVATYSFNDVPEYVFLHITAEASYVTVANVAWGVTE